MPWTEAEARAALQACRRSGESVAAFARRHGLRPGRLTWWRQRLSASAGSSTVGKVVREASLVPVMVRAAATGGVVVTDGEVRVEVGDTTEVEPGWVAALLRLAREARK